MTAKKFFTMWQYPHICISHNESGTLLNVKSVPIIPNSRVWTRMRIMYGVCSPEITHAVELI